MIIVVFTMNDLWSVFWTSPHKPCLFQANISVSAGYTVICQLVISFPSHTRLKFNVLLAFHTRAGFAFHPILPNLNVLIITYV
jgi:hypothetical protein